MSKVSDVPEELLDKVDVGHEHTAAAVAGEAELVHGGTVVWLD